METAKIRNYNQSFENILVRQTEWTGRRGVLLILAMYTGVIGSATFLLGLFLPMNNALLIGWILAVVGKGIFHVVFLGRSERFWRALMRPQNSWLSRGSIGLTLFGLLGLIYLLPIVQGYFPGISIPVSAESVAGLFWVNAVLAAFLLMYDGFLVSASVGIPLWNKGLIQILFPLFGLLAGTGVLSFLHHLDPVSDVIFGKVETTEQILLVLGALAIIYALTHVRKYSNAAKWSVNELTRGYARVFFWAGVVLLTIVLPLIAVFFNLFVVALPGIFLTIIALLSVIGEFFFKYSILTAGIHDSLFPSKAVEDMLSLNTVREAEARNSSLRRQPMTRY